MDAALETRRRRFRRFSAVVLGGLVVFGLTDVRRRARIDPAAPESHRTDLTIFTGAGGAFLADDDPYRQANPRGWKYAYPPLCALALAPLATLDTQAQAVIWYALSVAMCWLAWCEVVRISRRLGWDVRLRPDNTTGLRLSAWIAVAAAALPTLNCLQRGQVGILYGWLLLWGLRLLIESADGRGAFVAGVLLALPAVIKVTPALPALAAVCGWSLMQLRDRRSDAARTSFVRSYVFSAPLGWGVGCGLFLFVIPSAVIGWEANVRHLRTWTQSIAVMAVEVDPASTVETPYTLRNQNLTNAVYRLGNWIDYVACDGPNDRAIDAVPFNPQHDLAMDAAWVGPVLLIVRLALLGLLATAGWRLCQPGDLRGLATLFGLACAASLIVSPLSRGHYFVVLLPAVLWMPLILDVPPRAALRWAMVPLVLTVAHYGALDLAGRTGVLGLGLTLWYTAAIGALLRRPAVRGVVAPYVATRQSWSRAA